MHTDIEVFAKTDADGRILALSNNIFLKDFSGWQLLDRFKEGANRDRYVHPSSGYFPDGLRTEEGAHRYCFDGTQNPKYRKTTLEEQNAELAARPTKRPDSRDLAIAQLMREVAELKEGRAANV